MRNIKIHVLTLMSVLILMAGTPVFAQVGKVIFTLGQVTFERPDPGVLTKGMPVFEGDVIVTGPRGYAQILLDDRTKIAIRPDSRFVIDAVEMPATGSLPAIGAGITPRTQFTLQKGGFRTLTGRIASMQPAAYQVSTPSATIGIRGTNYVARMCSGDCGPTTDDGLFVGVSDGSIFLANNGGELDLATNQYGYARNFTTAPVRLIAPPATLQDEGLDVLLEEEEEEEGEAEGEEQTAQTESEESDEESSESEESAEEVASEFSSESEVAETDASGTDTTATTTTTQPDQEITAFTADGTPIDLTDGGSTPRQRFSFSTSEFALGTVAASGSLVVDDGGGVTSFQALGSSGATETYEIGSASLHNIGFDPNTELRWGRWSEGIATVDGTDLDLNISSLHYVLAPDQDAPTQVITGSADYVLVGNTDPTDNLGNIGVLGSASLAADFTNATVTSDLQLGINNQVWQASGTGSIDSTLFNGLYNTVTVNGVSGGSGSFGGIFSGFGDLTPLGAALNYNLNNGSGTTVNGAAVFNQIPSE